MKSTTNTGNWVVLHRYDQTKFGALNTTAAFDDASFNASFTSTSFKVKGGFNITANSGTYVAYLFAHDAGGFGLSGTDNVISCGSYTGNGSAAGPTVTLGYEPQWLLVKCSSSTGDWNLIDNMRGFVVGGTDAELNPNLSSAESTGTFVTPTSTGFQINTTDAGYNTNSAIYIYIAIRRGPMKVPTSGTSVFKPFTYDNSAGGFTQTQNAGFPTDLAFETDRALSSQHYLVSRLQGPRAQMSTANTFDESTFNTGGDQQKFDLQNLFAQQNSVSSSVLLYCLRRAPGFMDVVCDTGTGSAHTITHNLGAVPELMIRKKRSAADNWIVYANNDPTDYLILNSTAATADLDTMWNDTAPTSTVFTVGTNDDVNQNTGTFVTYLFATVAGVSKVGSYTGNGSSQTINCGFTGGAKFVLIKRINSTGDWYVWDSARGIVAGNDPHLSLNDTAAEVTTDDSVDTNSTGFIVNQLAATNINVSSANYIFLAIA